MIKNKAIILSIFLLTGCEKHNSHPTYGETGLPKNCRAIVQSNLDLIKGIRMSEKNHYQQLKEIDGALNSIERNCGRDGYSWENN